MALPPRVTTADLVAMLRKLIMRTGESDHLPSPIVCLVHEHRAGEARDAKEVTSSLKAAMEKVKPVAVPFARVVVSDHVKEAATTEEVATEETTTTGSMLPPLLPLLNDLRHQLAETFDRAPLRSGGARLRFPHYRMADWLTRQDLTGSGDDPRAELFRRMITRINPETTPLMNFAVENAPSASVRLVLSFFKLFWPLARTWLWLSGAVPGRGRETRWLLRQSYMSPRPAGDFLAFAQRLAVRRASDEWPRQMRLLLVHAFLQDLRIAYRRRLWRPSTWRRTANPVVLIGGVARGNGGAELISLINEVRNGTGEDDPLLVIAECVTGFTPPHTVEGDAPGGPSADALAPPEEVTPDGSAKAPETVEAESVKAETVKTEDAYLEWRRDLDDRRVRMKPDAWYLMFTVDPGTVPDTVFKPAGFVPPKPPLLARPYLLLTATTAAVALVGGCALWVGMPYMEAGCVPLLNHDGVSVTLVNGECVGYSDSADRLFGGDASNPGSAARLHWAEQAIFRQNACVERALAADPRRQRLTIVYLAGFDSDSNLPAWISAQAEELEGLLLQQIRQNGKAYADGHCGPASTDYYLRIVIANGGPAMAYADTVVDDRLSELIRDDPNVIGVMGLDRSIPPTEKAIAKLGNLGVPVVTTTLSGTHLDRDSPLYFQMGPSNPVQAKLVVDYVKSLRGVRRVHVFHPRVETSKTGVPNDLYVASLVQSLEDQLKAARVRYADHTWTRGETGVEEKFPTACSEEPGNIIFYAGRHERFADFLTEIFSECNATGQTTPIIAGDAISRFLADVGNDPGDIPAGVDIDFISKGSRIVLAGRHCLDPSSPPSALRMSTTLVTFCADLSDLYKEHKQSAGDPAAAIKPPRWAGEYIGLAYDVAGMLLQAARPPDSRRYADLGVVYRPNRAAVAQQLRDKPYRGVTGTFQFATSRVQDSADVAILHVRDIRNAVDAPTCLYERAYAERETDGRNLCPQKQGAK